MGRNNSLATDSEPGERITLNGRVLNRNKETLGNGVRTFWQADAQGRYSNFDPGEWRMVILEEKPKRTQMAPFYYIQLDPLNIQFQTKARPDCSLARLVGTPGGLPTFT